MGAGGSSQSVQEHLDKQEACIKKIQAALAKQGGGAPAGVAAGGFVEGEPEECASEDSDYEDEVELARAILSRNEALRDVRRHEEDEAGGEGVKDFEWTPFTEEEEKELKYSKPWLLSMPAPSDWEYNKPERDAMPDAHLRLEYVYGYRTRCCRNNLVWVSDQKAVYFSAKVAIVHDFATNTQQFFMGHTDTISSIAHHAERSIVATGDQAVAVICVWDVHTQKQLAKLASFHKKAVVSLSFSHCGKHLISLGLDDAHTVAMYDWEAGAKIAQAELGVRRIFGIKFVPGSNTQLVSTGVKHINFWTFSADGSNSQLVGTEAKLGKRGINQGFMDSSVLGGLPVVATSGGEIYKFNTEGQLIDICYAHNGSIASLVKHGDLLVSGGRDGYICVWSSSFVKVMSISLQDINCRNNSIRSLDSRGDELLVGCITGSIYTVNVQTRAKKLMVSYHSGDLTAKQRYGELWAIAEDPSGPRFATVCDDSVLRVWDSDTHECVHMSSIGIATAGGPARSLCWSPDGNWIACGFLQGSIALFQVNNNYTEHFRLRFRKRRIQCLRFSPCSAYLAVGSADNIVDIFDTAKNFAHISECRGCTSVVLSIDFSTDSKYIQVSTQDYFLQHFAVPSGQAVDAMETRDCAWATQTSFLGWSVQGIWSKSSDGSDINAISKSHTGDLIATANEYGDVSLFKHPCVGSGLGKQGRLARYPKSVTTSGQSQVTNVAWHNKDTRLFTAGGEDMSLFQWSVATGAQ